MQAHQGRSFATVAESPQTFSFSYAGVQRATLSAMLHHFEIVQPIGYRANFFQNQQPITSWSWLAVTQIGYAPRGYTQRVHGVKTKTKKTGKR